MSKTTFLILAGFAVFLIWFRGRGAAAVTPAGAKVNDATARPPTSVSFDFGVSQGVAAASIIGAASAAMYGAQLFGYTPPAQGSTALMVTGNDGDAEALRTAQLEYVN